MTYLVFSDTHGSAAGMCRIIEQNRRDTAGVIFLGDGMSDVEKAEKAFPELTFYAVAGNCDVSAKYLGREWQEKLITLEGKKILIMHGHTRGVKWGTEEAVSFARRSGADVLMFGHTHEAVEEFLPGDIMRRELYVFNPGSASRPRYGEPSFGRITIQNGCILLSHGSINRREV